jgi:hypothetical protein
MRNGIVSAKLRKKKVPLGALAQPAIAGAKSGGKGSGIATGPGSFPDLLYQGGPVIVDPQVYAVYLGDWTGSANQARITQLNQFIGDFLHSSYMNVLAQYGIGSSGTFVNSVTITDVANTLVDTDFHAVLQTAITAGTLPEPAAGSSITFIIYLDDNKVVTDESICEAVNGNFGYHSAFVTTAGNPCYYAIIPGLNNTCVSTVCGGLAPGETCSINEGATTQVQRQTQVSSHELSEMFTDPQVSTSKFGWNDNDPQTGEIGDLCNGQVGTITVGSNTWNVQLMYSKWDDLTTNGSNPCVATEQGPLPSLLPNFYFTVLKDTFGVDEVTDQPSWPKAFWLTLEGYSASQLGSTIPQFSDSFLADTDLRITPNLATPIVFEIPGDQFTPQRIIFYYDVTFNPPPFHNFPALNGPAIVKELHATIAMPGFEPTADVQFELIAGADPYFVNVDTKQNNAFYLSQDLRVFAVTPGIPNTQIPGAQTLQPVDPHTLDPQAGFDYIKELLAYLNGSFSNPQLTDPFLAANNIIPDPNNALFNDSFVNPSTPDPNSTQRFTNYNFAVARVRLTGSAGSKAADVKVFFRLFATQTNDTDYQPSTTYQSSPDSNQLPGSPLLGTDGAGNLITIPFFATGNFTSAPVNTDYSASSVNNGPIQIPTGSTGVWAYYGCFLNIYDQTNLIDGISVLQQLKGTHCCLVAQIADDDAPIPPPLNGVLAGPENSDKLAQRNLQVSLSENPQSRATHIIPQTFDIRPGPALAAKSDELLNYPDELLIDWGNTPIGSTAFIYWPQVAASGVLGIAADLYTTQLLSMADGHTIQCTVNGGVTYIPILPGSGPNIPGLITVDLPSTVRRGQEFDIVVRRITTRRPQPESRIAATPQRTASRGRARRAVAEQSVVGRKNWRYVVGSFQIRIPVTTREVMLFPEENTLAIMKFRLESLPPSNRWYPVLQRYIGYIAARVDGLGGNAAAIPASPNGAPVLVGPGHRHGVVYRGRICEVQFDCFGDFEGFCLESCTAEKIHFRTRRHAIGELALRMCKERLPIAVHVEHAEPHRIISIVVEC